MNVIAIVANVVAFSIFIAWTFLYPYLLMRRAICVVIVSIPDDKLTILYKIWLDITLTNKSYRLSDIEKIIICDNQIYLDKHITMSIVMKKNYFKTRITFINKESIEKFHSLRDRADREITIEHRQ